MRHVCTRSEAHDARAYRFQLVCRLSRPIYRGVFLLYAMAERILRYTNRVFPSHVPSIAASACNLPNCCYSFCRIIRCFIRGHFSLAERGIGKGVAISNGKRASLRLTDLVYTLCALSIKFRREMKR